MMKKLLLFSALFPLLCSAQEAKDFVVSCSGGSAQTFPLSGIKEITFNPETGDMTVSCAGQSVTFTEAQQWSAVFASAEVNAISEVGAADNKAEVSVFDLTGKRVGGKTLEKGVYIINGKKIVK